uniref:NR LBD domain-containing protein n=1 Tax=Meloidogyne floridensis TaxID=298350 RepID=A0A915PEM9_9BILA
MDFDYWEQIEETLPSNNSFYTTTTPQLQKTDFIVHSTTNHIETSNFINNSDEYLNINSNSTQQKPLIILLSSSARSDNKIISSPSNNNNVSKTTKNIERLSSPYARMPVIFSSNNNEDTNIYSTPTLTPVYRIRRDSLPESSKTNPKFVQKSSQNIPMQHQQFHDSTPSCSTISSNVVVEGAAVCAVCGDGHAKLHYGVDLTGKQRVPRVRKRPIGEELIGHMVTKGDENNGDTLLNASSSHLANSADDIHQSNNDNPLKNVSLRELFENRPASAKRTQMCYEPSRMAKPEELSKIAHRGAIAAVDWVESLMELVIDSISMVKNCYAPLTIFNFSARTAQKTQNPDILCLCSFSYVPRKLPAEFNGSNHLSNNLIDHAKNLSEEAQHATSALRNAVQDMLFHSVKELHPSQNSASRFGNLLLLLPTITTLSGLMSENMQFCQVFGWTDPLLNELFNNGDEEKTASYNQEGPLSAFLADEDAFDLTTGGGPPPVSYSPPMLGGESSSQGNYSAYEQPSPPLQPCSSSSSNSSSSPFTSSSLSCVCLTEKCEMNFDVGCNNDNDMFFDGEQVNFNDLSAHDHSSFQDIFFNKDSDNLIDQNNSDFPTSSDFYFFGENGEALTNSNILDFNGLMQ